MSPDVPLSSWIFFNFLDISMYHPCKIKSLEISSLVSTYVSQRIKFCIFLYFSLKIPSFNVKNRNWEKRLDRQYLGIVYFSSVKTRGSSWQNECKFHQGGSIVVPKSYQRSFVPEASMSPDAPLSPWIFCNFLNLDSRRHRWQLWGGQGLAGGTHRLATHGAQRFWKGKEWKGKERNGKVRKGKNKLGAVGVGRGWPPFSSLAAKRTAPTNRQTPPPASPPLVLQRFHGYLWRSACVYTGTGRNDRLKNRGSPVSRGSEVSLWVPVQGDTYLTVRPIRAHTVRRCDQRRPTTAKTTIEDEEASV